MLHPNPDAATTRLSVLVTVLVALVIFGGLVRMAVEGDTAQVAMPEPPPPAGITEEGASSAPLLDLDGPATLAALGVQR
ncbi:MAG: hypothetical protein R3B72_33305 [Polyangiaceae bacterium]